MNQNSERSAQFEQQLRRKLQLIGRFEVLMRKHYSDALDEFERRFTVDWAEPDFGSSVESLAQDLEAHYSLTHAAFLPAVSEDSGVTLSEEARGVALAGIAAWSLGRAELQASRIMVTAQDTVSSALARTRASSDPAEGASDTARRARRLASPMLGTRARMVAGSETQMAAEAAKMIAAEASSGKIPSFLGDVLPAGVAPVPERQRAVLRKTWITQSDEVVRDPHSRAHGQVVSDVNRPFTVGGHDLLFPGDTSLGASLANVINCRCSAFYERIG